VLSLDAAHQKEGRLEVRFENPDARTDHSVLRIGDVTAPSGTWCALPLLGWEAESNFVRRVEVQIPSDVSGSFLRVRQ